MKGWARAYNSGISADIGLLLEGTYPFVSGGVSSWVNQIIKGFPELSFALVFIGGAREHYGKPRYPLPDNVTHLETHYLMDVKNAARPRRLNGNPELFSQLAELHEVLRRPGHEHLPELLATLVSELGVAERLDLETFLYSKEAWELISASYSQFCTEPSFVNYFWTVRMMHAPLFKLAEVAKGVPEVRALHSVSTGYAGFLGMLLRFYRKVPFVLSEHGIYTKERKIDLAQAEWIQTPQEIFGSNLDADVSYIRRLWIRFFESLGHTIYNAADPIVSLYEGNRQRQISDGAAPKRTRVIPNGIDLATYAAGRRETVTDPPAILALIGRVVPIKDIKTFIRAMRTVCNLMPQAEGWIVGPEDENPEYARECRALVETLGLQQSVKFLGFQRTEEVLRQVGVVVLTSISEALPLVVLEGYAAGVPAVVTDVGACRELIEGGGPEDRELGSSGCVVPIANPMATARATLKLLQEPAYWAAASKVAKQRVATYYTEQDMFSDYRDIYRQALAKGED